MALFFFFFQISNFISLLKFGCSSFNPHFVQVWTLTSHPSNLRPSSPSSNSLSLSTSPSKNFLTHFCSPRSNIAAPPLLIFCLPRVSTSLIGVKNSCCFPHFPFGISGLCLGFWPIYTSFQGWRLCSPLWNKCDPTKARNFRFPCGLVYVTEPGCRS